MHMAAYDLHLYSKLSGHLYLPFAVLGVYMGFNVLHMLSIYHGKD